MAGPSRQPLGSRGDSVTRLARKVLLSDPECGAPGLSRHLLGADDSFLSATPGCVTTPVRDGGAGAVGAALLGHLLRWGSWERPSSPLQGQH